MAIKLVEDHLKRLSIYHVFGIYEGELTSPIRIAPILPVKIVIQNYNSPTIKLLSGPTIEGPFTEVATIKNQEMKVVDAHGLWFDITLKENTAYGLYAYVFK